MKKKECYPDFENNVMIHCFPPIYDPEIRVHICECRAYEVKKKTKRNRFSGREEMLT